MTITPQKIEPYSKNEILFRWNNHTTYVLDYSELRFHCPCAGCVDEMTGKRTLKRNSVAPDIHPVRVSPIGRYAVQFEWSDRHSTGMYSFDLLFNLCQTKGRLLDA